MILNMCVHHNSEFKSLFRRSELRFAMRCNRPAPEISKGLAHTSYEAGRKVEYLPVEKPLGKGWNVDTIGSPPLLLRALSASLPRGH